MNYFSALCFAWAAVGLVTRVLIVGLGERWARWETGAVYTPKRPAWLLPLGLAGAALVAFTWYMAFTSGVPHGWAAALLLTLTLGKIGAFLFRYDAFVGFVRRAFETPALLRNINRFVVCLSLVLLVLGCLYACPFSSNAI